MQVSVGVPHGATADEHTVGHRQRDRQADGQAFPRNQPMGSPDRQREMGVHERSEAQKLSRGRGRGWDEGRAKGSSQDVLWQHEIISQKDELNIVHTYAVGCASNKKTAKGRRKPESALVGWQANTISHAFRMEHDENFHSKAQNLRLSWYSMWMWRKYRMYHNGQPQK